MHNPAWQRLTAGSAVVLLWQFCIFLWFLVGQGYDRSTASMVIWGSPVLIPLVALLLMTGVDDVVSRILRYRTALWRSLLLAVTSVWLPVWVIVALPLRSPFAEFWWALAWSAVFSAAWIVRWQSLGSAGQRVLLLGILLAGILGWRTLLFSFF